MINEIKINNNRKKFYEKMGYWGKKTLMDYWNESVKRYGNREFVVDEKGGRYTYNDVNEKAGAIASYFIEAGIKPQDIISFQVPVWSEFVLITIACMKVGAVINPIGMCYSGEELENILKSIGSKLYICPTWYHKTDYEEVILSIKNRVKYLNNVILIDKIKEKNSDNVTLNEIILKNSPFKYEVKVDSNHIAAILYTSGTCGGTKGVMLTHNNIIFSENNFNNELGLTKDDAIFMPAPLNHATGFHHGIIAPMLMGAKVVLQSKFKSREAIELMNTEKCTYSMGSTPFIYDILKAMEQEKIYLNSLKFYLCGGAMVSRDMVKKAYKYGIKLCEVYGSTESVPHVFVRPNEAIELMGNTSGRAMKGIEVCIVDDARKEVSPGILGEEASRGPNVFVGYIKDKEATDKVLDDQGWFYSGDLCVMDENGNINVVGRKKDIIVRGGENINSNDISNYLVDCPMIKDQAVIGMPDERLGERICVYVVLQKGIDSLNLKELLTYMEQKNIPKRYWPERLEIIKQIPRTDSGKVKKNLLVEDLKIRIRHMDLLFF